MSASRWQRVQELFLELETLDEAARAARLERIEPDAGLRTEVLRLLDAARAEQDTTDRIRNARPPSPALPERIGNLAVLGILGSGGFSTVYRAVRRVEDAEQRVAVKLFHAHRLGPDARRRFQREQQVLASLNHPGIVRFLDAGVTAEGQPYLVMEEVEGTTIAEHCDRLRLGVAARLDLVAGACRALQYAHRRLVVHLDLKPSNIRVTADGQVKLLDFGTAKLLDETGALTVTQQLTPVYASPERLRGEAGSVGSDVYSMGLVLFELITGAWPFRDRESIPALAARAGGTVEARSASTVCTADAASAQATTLDRLRKLLSGDLQAILSKALAHSPADRYGSVAELLEDLRRYRANEPVLAHPPGLLYRAGKFARRHARGLAAAAVAAALLSGAAAYAWRERVQGALRLQEARGIARYLLFDLYDRIVELPGSTAVRAQMAQQAQAELDRLARLAGADPALRLEAAAGYNRLAEIQGISGSSSLGNTEAALDNLAHARTLLSGLLAAQPDHRGALIENARNASLGAKLQNWNRRSTAAARPHIEQAMRDLARSKDPADPNWLRAWASLAVQRADLAEFEQNFAEETQIAAEALAALSQWPANLREGSDWLLRRVALLKRRGNASYYREQYAPALASYQEARQQLEGFDSLHPNRPEVLYALMDMSYQMAYCYGELKEPRRMVDATRDSIEIGARLLAYDRANQALERSYWNKRQALAEGLALLADYSSAVREQEAVLAARQAAHRAQPDSNLAAEDVLVTEATLAGILADAGHRPRACALAASTMERSRALHAAGGMTAKNWSEQQRMLARARRSCP